jgi:hypothetical protein
MTELIIGALALASIPAIRAAIKGYRAKKSVGNIVADAVEAAIDEVDKKKR